MTDRPNMKTGAGVIALFALLFWAQHDDAQRIGNPPSAAAQAAQEEAEAIAIREYAAQQACGRGKTPQWIDDKTVECLRPVDQPTRVAGGAP